MSDPMRLGFDPDEKVELTYRQGRALRAITAWSMILCVFLAYYLGTGVIARNAQIIGWTQNVSLLVVSTFLYLFFAVTLVTAIWLLAEGTIRAIVKKLLYMVPKEMFEFLMYAGAFGLMYLACFVPLMKQIGTYAPLAFSFAGLGLFYVSTYFTQRWHTEKVDHTNPVIYFLLGVLSVANAVLLMSSLLGFIAVMILCYAVTRSDSLFAFAKLFTLASGKEKDRYNPFSKHYSSTADMLSSMFMVLLYGICMILTANVKYCAVMSTYLPLFSVAIGVLVVWYYLRLICKTSKAFSFDNAYTQFQFLGFKSGLAGIVIGIYLNNHLVAWTALVFCGLYLLQKVFEARRLTQAVLGYACLVLLGVMIAIAYFNYRCPGIFKIYGL